MLLYKSVVKGLLKRFGSADEKVAWSRYVQRAKRLSFQTDTVRDENKYRNLYQWPLNYADKSWGCAPNVRTFGRDDFELEKEVSFPELPADVIVKFLWGLSAILILKNK